MNFDFDKALQDETNQILPNIHEHIGKDEYGDDVLLDWKKMRIDPEDRVFILKYKKSIHDIITQSLTDEDYFNTYLACEDNLLELINEKEKDLYWSMEITIGRILEDEYEWAKK